jgi:hypothetical protein
MGHDLIGNIHYGYLNRLAGVPPWIYEGGARGADWVYNFRIEPDNSPPVRTSIDRADALAVEIGTELADRFPDPAQLKPEHIRDALRTHFERFFEYGGVYPGR